MSPSLIFRFMLISFFFAACGNADVAGNPANGEKTARQNTPGVNAKSFEVLLKDHGTEEEMLKRQKIPDNSAGKVQVMQESMEKVWYSVLLFPLEILCLVLIESVNKARMKKIMQKKPKTNAK